MAIFFGCNDFLSMLFMHNSVLRGRNNFLRNWDFFGVRHLDMSHSFNSFNCFIPKSDISVWETCVFCIFYILVWVLSYSHNNYELLVVSLQSNHIYGGMWSSEMLMFGQTGFSWCHMNPHSARGLVRHFWVNVEKWMPGFASRDTLGVFLDRPWILLLKPFW